LNTDKIAAVLEAIILTEGEMSEWFGNAQVLKSARYDDYTNKIDLVVEWYSPEDGSRILALAVDVTFGESTSWQKLNDIKSEILRGQLGSMRYFRDNRGDIWGTRKNIPRVVIGVNKSSVEELAGLWINDEKKKLGAHPVQRVLLEEMYSQMLAMQEFAQAKGMQKIAESYLPGLTIIKKLLQEKRALNYGDLNQDPVFLDILTNTARVFSK
jgi:hypothetical protein